MPCQPGKSRHTMQPKERASKEYYTSSHVQGARVEQIKKSSDLLIMRRSHLGRAKIPSEPASNLLLLGKGEKINQVPAAIGNALSQATSLVNSTTGVRTAYTKNVTTPQMIPTNKQKSNDGWQCHHDTKEKKTRRACKKAPQINSVKIGRKKDFLGPFGERRRREI